MIFPSAILWRTCLWNVECLAGGAISSETCEDSTPACIYCRYAMCA